MKKFFRNLLMILLIIIFIIGFIFGIMTIVKFIKLNNIYKKIDKYVEYESFYMKTTQTINDETTETEAYYRNGTSKQIASNGVYTWTDGERAYVVDETNSTVYTASTENNITLVSYNMFAAPIQGYNEGIVDRFFLAGDVNTTIKKEKIDDKEYYCIKTKENNAIKKVWVEKDSSKIKKASIEFTNGDVIYYEYELQFNQVKASDISLTDITGYKLISGETGTILSESFNEETTTVETEESTSTAENATTDNTVENTNMVVNETISE